MHWILLSHLSWCTLSGERGCLSVVVSYRVYWLHYLHIWLLTCIRVFQCLKSCSTCNIYRPCTADHVLSSYLLVCKCWAALVSFLAISLCLFSHWRRLYVFKWKKILCHRVGPKYVIKFNERGEWNELISLVFWAPATEDAVNMEWQNSQVAEFRSLRVTFLKPVALYWGWGWGWLWILFVKLWHFLHFQVENHKNVTRIKRTRLCHLFLMVVFASVRLCSVLRQCVQTVCYTVQRSSLNAFSQLRSVSNVALRLLTVMELTRGCTSCLAESNSVKWLTTWTMK